MSDIVKSRGALFSDVPHLFLGVPQEHINHHTGLSSLPFCKRFLPINTVKPNAARKSNHCILFATKITLLQLSFLILGTGAEEFLRRIRTFP